MEIFKFFTSIDVEQLLNSFKNVFLAQAADYFLKLSYTSTLIIPYTS